MNQMQSANNQGPVIGFPMQGAPNPTHSKNLLVIAVIIIILLVAAGVAYWMLAASPANAPEMKEQVSVPTPTPAPVLDSDSAASIEKDLNDTSDLGDIDKELSDVDRELQGL